MSPWVTAYEDGGKGYRKEAGGQFHHRGFEKHE